MLPYLCLIWDGEGVWPDIMDVVLIAFRIKLGHSSFCEKRVITFINFVTITQSAQINA